MKKYSLLFFALLFCFVSFSRERGEIQYGPWITNVGETEFTVLWKTDAKVLSYVAVAPSDKKPDDIKDWARHYQIINGRCPSCTMHTVKVTGLKPGTRYELRIFGREVLKDDSAYAIEYKDEVQYGGPNERLTVKTLDSKAKTCRFSMVNDMHCKPGKYQALLSSVKGDDIDFLTLCGDIVNYVQSIDTVLKYTFPPAKDIMLSAPVVYAMGNHESRGREFDKFPPLFPTPTGKPYYSFRQGPVAFLVLDASEDKKDSHREYSGYAHYEDYRAEELEWLKKAVKEKSFKSAPKKVVIMHVPTIVGTKGRTTQKWVTENFAPILSSAGVSLMLSGHLHKQQIKAAGEDGIPYTIIVNSNSTRLDFEADAKTITIKIYSKTGELLEQMVI